MKLSIAFKILLYIIVGLIDRSNSRLSIKSPEALKNKFDKINEIDYAVITPQNKITYKRAFIGNLMLSDPETACANVTSVRSVGDAAVYNPILIAAWGDCHYAQKVKNAEAAGAKMLILVLKHKMEINHPSIKQLPMQTNLEVLVISQDDGYKLVSYLNEVKSKPETDRDSVVEMTYSYNTVKHVNFQASSKVVIDFWFVAADLEKASYDFLSDLTAILKDFGDKVIFNPHYVLWRCDECGRELWKKQDTRCISGGRCCDPEVLTPNKLSGGKGVVETLRQICFRKLSSNAQVTTDDIWWKYVLAFGHNCVDKNLDELDGCRNDIYTSAGFPPKTKEVVENCMRNSFENPIEISEFESTILLNSDLDKELTSKDDTQIDHYPSLYINKDRYTGSYKNKFSIKNMICSHFVQENLPHTCLETEKSELDHTIGDIMTYICIVIISIVAMASMLYCVRRTVKRQVMTKMNDEIAHIVTQYKQINDKATHDDNV